MQKILQQKAFKANLAHSLAPMRLQHPRTTTQWAFRSQCLAADAEKTAVPSSATTSATTAITLMTSNYSCLQVCMGWGGAESVASHTRKLNKSYEIFSDPKYAHIPEVNTVNAARKGEHFMQQARLYVETI